MSLFIKDGVISYGACCAVATPMLIPRDANLGASSLIWGIDRCTDTPYPLAINSSGELGITFSGSVTLGSVTIKDEASATCLDIIAGEGQSMVCDNHHGIPVFGVDPTGCSSMFHFTCTGDLKITLSNDSVGLATECTSQAILSALGGSIDPVSATAEQCLCTGALDFATCICNKFRLKAVLIHSSAAITECVFIRLNSSDGSNFNTLLQTCNLTAAQNVAYFPPIDTWNLKCGDEIYVCVTNNTCPDALVSASVRYETI